ncbi:MAG: DUF6298 domain-containing protein, partial [Candidatus Symbiothrix sp.]|nr:DUF6298 domain-containing protein [Candidatus Symbiothrix sp.]
MKNWFLILLFLGISTCHLQAQLKPDSLGNQIPDFSYCGYQAGNVPIPGVPVKIVVPVVKGDATPYIQEAIDRLAKLPLDKNGFRGAVLLHPGDYSVNGNIQINASGIVLRGSGANATRLIAAGKDRRTLICIEGKNDRKTGRDTFAVADNYVPAGAMELQITGKHPLKAGDKILIIRPSTKEWIETLGTAHFGGGITALGWKPGEHDLFFDRTVTSVKAGCITFDAPLTTALDKKFGGGYLLSYQWENRIKNAGVENLSCISEYDAQNPKDEAHAWIAVNIANACDAWVRNVIFRHFAGSAVFVQETVKRITVENCKSLEPVSEIGGQRRNTFFTMGQQGLFQRLYSEYGYHDFATGFCAPGPNAFVQCHAYLPYNYSGAVSSWASGVLFDIVNIEGNALRYANLYQDNQGAGWNVANSVFWQCAPSLIECFAPPTAMNWAFGSWSEFSGNGYWESSNNHIQPRSLYYSQLEKRLGKNYVDRSMLIPVNTSATSSPTIEQARELTDASGIPAIALSEWIDKLIAEDSLY